MRDLSGIAINQVQYNTNLSKQQKRLTSSQKKRKPNILSLACLILMSHTVIQAPTYFFRQVSGELANHVPGSSLIARGGQQVSRAYHRPEPCVGVTGLSRVDSILQKPSLSVDQCLGPPAMASAADTGFLLRTDPNRWPYAVRQRCSVAADWHVEFHHVLSGHGCPPPGALVRLLIRARAPPHVIRASLWFLFLSAWALVQKEQPFPSSKVFVLVLALLLETLVRTTQTIQPALRPNRCCQFCGPGGPIFTSPIVEVFIFRRVHI